MRKITVRPVELEELPRHLIYLRKKHCYKQREVSEYLSVDRSTYAYYETGKTTPSLGILCKIARLYNISIVDILKGEYMEQKYENL